MQDLAGIASSICFACGNITKYMSWSTHGSGEHTDVGFLCTCASATRRTFRVVCERLQNNLSKSTTVYYMRDMVTHENIPASTMYSYLRTLKQEQRVHMITGLDLDEVIPDYIVVPNTEHLDRDGLIMTKHINNISLSHCESQIQQEVFAMHYGVCKLRVLPSVSKHEHTNVFGTPQHGAIAVLRQKVAKRWKESTSISCARAVLNSWSFGPPQQIALAPAIMISMTTHEKVFGYGDTSNIEKLQRAIARGPDRPNGAVAVETSNGVIQKLKRVQAGHTLMIPVTNDLAEKIALETVFYKFRKMVTDEFSTVFEEKLPLLTKDTMRITLPNVKIPQGARTEPDNDTRIYICKDADERARSMVWDQMPTWEDIDKEVEEISSKSTMKFKIMDVYERTPGNKWCLGNPVIDGEIIPVLIDRPIDFNLEYNAKFPIRIGDTVHRQIQEANRKRGEKGDIVLGLRSPALHSHNCIGYVVRKGFGDVNGLNPVAIACQGTLLLVENIRGRRLLHR